MYFFDIEDYCASVFPVIGTNAQNIFTSAPGGICSDMATTYRATRDTLYSNVSQWYTLSNPVSINYQYNSSQTLPWPSSTATYTLYSGGFTAPDDGYSNTPIVLPVPFASNGVSSTNLYVSTNGYFTLGTGTTTYTSPGTPYPGPPASLAGNPGDNYLLPGADLSDSLTQKQNVYYKTGNDSFGRYFVKLLVYGGTCCNASTVIPTSWIANYYRDSQYHWLETRISPTATSQGLSGPYNVTSVAQQASTTSQVWRGDVNAQNWEYMGNGTVSTPETPPKACPECDVPYTQFMSTINSLNFFWADAENNFQNITWQQYQTFVTQVYQNVCYLKRLLKCVDGDEFEDFVI